MRRKWGVRMSGETGSRKLSVIYARREPTTDPNLPPRTYAKDVVLSLTRDFAREARRYGWNDPDRPTRAPRNGITRVTLDGAVYRIVWEADLPGDWEK